MPAGEPGLALVFLSEDILVSWWCLYDAEKETPTKVLVRGWCVGGVELESCKKVGRVTRELLNLG